MKEVDIKHYEDMSEMFQTQGWKDLVLIAERDLKGMDEVVWGMTDDREIATLQGHRKPLVWIIGLQESTGREFEEIQKQEAEDLEDANL